MMWMAPLLADRTIPNLYAAYSLLIIKNSAMNNIFRQPRCCSAHHSRFLHSFSVLPLVECCSNFLQNQIAGILNYFIKMQSIWPSHRNIDELPYVPRIGTTFAFLKTPPVYCKRKLISFTSPDKEKGAFYYSFK